MFDQCGAYLRRSRELFKKAYGENNPMIPVTLKNEARILTKQHKYDESLPLYEEAIKGMEKQKQEVADLQRLAKNMLMQSSMQPSMISRAARLKGSSHRSCKKMNGELRASG